jgi:hypothetical protein
MGKPTGQDERERLSRIFGFACRASVSHFQPLTSGCLESGRFALAISRKIDAMGSKFTADFLW